MKKSWHQSYFLICFLEYVGLFLAEWAILGGIAWYFTFRLPLWVMVLLVFIVNPFIVYFTSLKILVIYRKEKLRIKPESTVSFNQDLT